MDLPYRKRKGNMVAGQAGEDGDFVQLRAVREQVREVKVRVKSGRIHHTNSFTHFQTVEIQMRRLLMSRLIRISLFA